MTIRQEDNLRTLVEERALNLDANSFSEFIRFCNEEGMGDALNASGWNTSRDTTDEITTVTVTLNPIEVDNKPVLNIGDYIVDGPQYVDGIHYVVFEIKDNLVHAVDISNGELKVIALDAIPSMIEAAIIGIRSGEEYTAKVRIRHFGL